MVFIALRYNPPSYVAKSLKFSPRQFYGRPSGPVIPARDYKFVVAGSNDARGKCSCDEHKHTNDVNF